MMPIQSPPYHVATVVPDLEAAKAVLGEQLGLVWGQPLRGDMRFQTAEGIVPVAVDLVYSLGGPPHVELIQQQPGTFYEPLGLHHLAYWVADIPAASAELTATGFPLEAVAVDAEGNWAGGAYHRSPTGLRIELVSAPNSGPRLARYLAGGPYR